jgi:hypothetical protein
MGLWACGASNGSFDMDRRIFSISLLTGALGLAACASEDGPSGGGHGGRAREDEPEMLFISPMGEPFRAKPPAPYPVVDWFKGADKDGDGKLTLAEFQADAERFFHVLDINKDGVIDHREIYYYEHKICPEMLGLAYSARLDDGRPKLWLAQFGPGQLGGPPVTNNPGGGASLAPQDGGRLGDKDQPLIGAAAFGLLADPEPVQGSDIRISGIITLNDFKTRAQQRFDLLDFNHKGYLTLSGLPETEAQKNVPHHGGFQRGLRRRPDAA